MFISAIKQLLVVLFIAYIGVPTIYTGAHASETCVWKTSDIMDPRIDVGAQKSLMRQMSAGLPHSAQASAMISAIKNGDLVAISLPPRKIVAERAARMTPKKYYWQLLAGRKSICLREPVGEKPMIVYREKLPPELIDMALRDAWAECSLPTPRNPCEYLPDRWAPKKECATGDWDVIYYKCMGCDVVVGEKVTELKNCPPMPPKQITCEEQVYADAEKCIESGKTHEVCDKEIQFGKRLRDCILKHGNIQRHDQCNRKASDESGCMF